MNWILISSGFNINDYFSFFELLSSTNSKDTLLIKLEFSKASLYSDWKIKSLSEYIRGLKVKSLEFDNA